MRSEPKTESKSHAKPDQSDLTNPDSKTEMTKKEKMKEKDRKRRERKKEERKKERLNGKSEKTVEEIAEEVENIKLAEDSKNNSASSKKDSKNTDSKNSDRKIKSDRARKEEKAKKEQEKKERAHKKTSKKAQDAIEQNPTKIIIRNIPPFIKSENFIGILSGFLPEYTYYNFSVADQSLKPWHTSTAYFNFKTHEMANQFFNRWNNFNFANPDTELGNSQVGQQPSNYVIQVEIAPFQKLPSDKSSNVVEEKGSFMELKRELSLSGKIFNSLEFNQFLRKDEKKEGEEVQDSQAKLEQFMNDMESRKAAMDSKKKSTVRCEIINNVIVF